MNDHELMSDSIGLTCLIDEFYKITGNVLEKHDIHDFEATDTDKMVLMVLRETVIRPQLSVRAEVKAQIMPYLMPIYLGMSLDDFFSKMVPHMPLWDWSGKYSKAAMQASQLYDKWGLDEALPFWLLAPTSVERKEALELSIQKSKQHDEKVKKHG